MLTYCGFSVYNVKKESGWPGDMTLNIESTDRISVILPVFNAEDTVAKTVDSVLFQTYENIELIIIDDASTDGSRAILEKFAASDARIKLLINEANIGVLKTRIRGVRSAKGRWIAFIDSDDLWDKEKLKKQMDLLKETGSVLSYCASAFIRNDGDAVPWVLHVPPTVTYKSLLKQNIISNSSVVVNRNVFLKYSPFSEDHRDMHEDFACWLLILRSGNTVCGIDEPLLTYRVNENSMSGNKFHSAVLNWFTYRYVGLNIFRSAFYMVRYTVRGVIKYNHIGKKG